MKTLEYVRKYNLMQNAQFDHSSFIFDLAVDFEALLQYQKEKASEFTLAIFEQTVKQIRQKWDSISNKTAGELPESLWGYFYATVVVKQREAYLPSIIEEEFRIKKMSVNELIEYINAFNVIHLFNFGTFARKEDENKLLNQNNHFLSFAYNIYKKKLHIKNEQDKEAERKRFQKDFEDYHKRRQAEYDWFNYIFGGMKMNLSVPTESFKVLELDTNATMEDVKKAYRKLSMIHHPDKNGSQEKFVAICDAKTRCEAYLTK